MEDEAYLNRPQLAEWLTVRGYKASVATLETFATRGGGPVYYRRGRWVVYKLSDAKAWLDSKTSGPFSHSSEMQRKNHAN